MAKVTSKADKNYEAMKKAIQVKDYQKMTQLVNNAEYETNRKSEGGDKRTALHTATSCNDKKAISLLMKQKDIDPLITTSRDMSALMIAAASMKLEALKQLLSYDRVDVDQRDLEDQTAEDHFEKSHLGTDLQRTKARMLFQNARDRGKEVSSGGQVAILIANQSYQDMERLDGSVKDLEAMKDLLTASGYTIHEIHDSEDILEDIEAVMTQIDESSITHLQLLYAGNML